MSLTETGSPPKPATMGRPPLGNKSTNVRLSEDVKARIAALTRNYGLARFIREAIDEKLAREEQAERKPKAGQ